MRAVLQRVRQASVRVGEGVVGQIEGGLLILLGVAQGDTPEDADRLARKAADLRIFNGPDGRFHLSLLDVKGKALVVSQFTLFADTRRGRRPSFTDAAAPDVAEPLCGRFVSALQGLGVLTATGVFGAHMVVSLENDGPVTILLDTRDSDVRKPAGSDANSEALP